MATVRKRKNGKVQIVIRRKKNGRMKSYYKEVEYISKKQLNLEIAQFELEVEEKKVSVSTKTTVDDVYKHFMGYHIKQNDIKDKTVSTYVNQYETYIKDYFGKVKINAIDREDIREWIKYLSEEYVGKITKKHPTPRTIKNALNFLSRLFNYARYELDLIQANPCEKIIIKKTKAVRDDLYTEEEILQLVQILFDEVKKESSVHPLAVLIFIFMGLRTGELYGLKWEDIDFENKTMYIHNSRTLIYKEHKTAVQEGTPKTSTSNRKLSIPSFIFELIEKEKIRQDRLMTAFPDSVHSGYFMARPDGKEQTPSNTYKWFMKLIQKHGLKKTTIHDLRHSHTAMLANMEVTLYDIANRLGHSDPSVTLNTYWYLFKNKDTEISHKLEEYFLSEKTKSVSKVVPNGSEQ